MRYVEGVFVLFAAIVLVWVLGHMVCNCMTSNAEANPVGATSFTHMTGPDAKWNGDVFFCAKKPGTNEWAAPGTRGFRKIKMNGHERGIAHRTLPCGTLVELAYRSIHRGGDGKVRRVLVPVVDRGPYWAIPADCRPWWGRCWRYGRAIIRLRGSKLWVRPTHVDITALVARELKFPGKAAVHFRVVRRVLRRLTRQP